MAYGLWLKQLTKDYYDIEISPHKSLNQYFKSERSARFFYLYRKLLSAIRYPLSAIRYPLSAIPIMDNDNFTNREHVTF